MLRITLTIALLLIALQVCACRAKSRSSATQRTDAGVQDAGASDAKTDAGRTDSAMTVMDGAVDCPLVSTACPPGCDAFMARLYNRTRMCLEDVYESVGCWPADEARYGDPRCAQKKTTGAVFRVPLSFIEPTGLKYPSSAWTPCSAHDDNFVSSTVTPSCDTLADGGIYDGGP